MLIKAPVKLPNIKPMIKMAMVFFTFWATTRTVSKIIKDPRLPAITKLKGLLFSHKKPPPSRELPKISTATPKLAPELIPRTNGPAKGFLNKVCIRSPLTLSPEPTKIAVMAFGSRKLSKMYWWESFKGFCPKISDTISVNGMETEPELIFTKNTKTKNRNIKIKGLIFVLMMLGFKINHLVPPKTAAHNLVKGSDGQPLLDPSIPGQALADLLQSK